MLKRIAIEDLRVGMYLHEICGSWLDHPFWRTSFLLDNPADVETLCDSGIREVWIDTSKGRDAAAQKSRDESHTAPDRKPGSGASALQVKERLPAAADQGNTSGTVHASEPHVEQRVPAVVEITRAAQICAKAKTAIASMFQEARMGKALDVDLARPLVDEIGKSVMRNSSVLISLARLKTKDNYTYMHSVAVCALMVALARRLGLTEQEAREAGLAGLLHDIGKSIIPLEILNKPAKLTEEEFAVIREHPAAGRKILNDGRNVSEIVLDVCLHHQEKIDGSGYPDHLSGKEIGYFAKMAAVCDVYDAITSDRAYRKGWTPADSLRKMAEWSEHHFEKEIFHAFLKTMGIYPVGSLVLLKSGRLGVVVDQAEESVLTPKVKVFFSTRSDMRIPPEVVDLSRVSGRDKVVSIEDAAKWRITNLEQLWSGVPQAA